MICAAMSSVNLLCASTPVPRGYCVGVLGCCICFDCSLINMCLSPKAKNITIPFSHPVYPTPQRSEIILLRNWFQTFQLSIYREDLWKMFSLLTVNHHSNLVKKKKKGPSCTFKMVCANHTQPFCQLVQWRFDILFHFRKFVLVLWIFLPKPFLGHLLAPRAELRNILERIGRRIALLLSGSPIVCESWIYYKCHQYTHISRIASSQFYHTQLGV